MFRLSYIFTAIFSLVAINSVAGIKFSDRVDEHMLSNGLKVNVPDLETIPTEPFL